MQLNTIISIYNYITNFLISFGISISIQNIINLHIYKQNWFKITVSDYLYFLATSICLGIWTILVRNFNDIGRHFLWGVWNVIV